MPNSRGFSVFFSDVQFFWKLFSDFPEEARVGTARKGGNTVSANRLHLPGTVHLVTNRTEHEMFLLHPTKNITALIQGWFAKSLCEYGDGLDIYAFVFLGNHYHILLKDNKGTLAAFLWFFQANLARAVNRELGRKGRFWAREYDDVIVDGEQAFWDVYAYTVANAVKSGLVGTASEWPGWNSLKGAIGDGRYTCELFNRTKYHNATRRGQKRNKADFVEQWRFKLAVPESIKGKSSTDRATFIKETLRNAEAAFRKARGNKPPFGVRAILRQRPLARPQTPSFRPRRRFHCSNAVQEHSLLDGYRKFTADYRSVHRRYLLASASRSRTRISWPDGNFPPSSLYPVFCEVA
jgi:putative transposase